MYLLAYVSLVHIRLSCTYLLAVAAAAAAAAAAATTVRGATHLRDDIRANSPLIFSFYANINVCVM